jgi:hypothetical protein
MGLLTQAVIVYLFLKFFTGYFPHLHFQCYLKSPPYPPPPLPYPPTPNSLPWHSPVLRYIKFVLPMGPSLHWWPSRPSSDTFAARVKSSGVLVISYCCSTYRVADPFSSLDTFSSFSIGSPVIHPIADCEHPLMCLLGPGIVNGMSKYMLLFWLKYKLIMCMYVCELWVYVFIFFVSLVCTSCVQMFMEARRQYRILRRWS